ncbi:MAG: hypothetical protein ACK4L8_15255 [Nitrincola lacisaponensis]|uniref:Uncharacterized protein n=1 Tax=Nitrincola lacisaponensis TaxID=267850 RepID=A0A063XZX5_9GAMM|nr:hypothetical protein [Nitrincola lacisaponensis]KDE39658.1 hypothetical protein ADINL_1936 [Nitrincola lacisaponensis]
MEFLIVFIVSAVFLLLIGVAMAFGKSPSYRPDRQYVLDLIKGIETRTTSPQAWDMLIGYPISHDPELEAIRRWLVALHEGTDGHKPAREGINGYIYDRESRQRLVAVIERLEKLIAEAPVTREF